MQSSETTLTLSTHHFNILMLTIFATGALMVFHNNHNYGIMTLPSKESGPGSWSIEDRERFYLGIAGKGDNATLPAAASDVLERAMASHVAATRRTRLTCGMSVRGSAAEMSLSCARGKRREWGRNEGVRLERRRGGDARDVRPARRRRCASRRFSVVRARTTWLHRRLSTSATHTSTRISSGVGVGDTYTGTGRRVWGQRGPMARGHAPGRSGK